MKQLSPLITARTLPLVALLFTFALRGAFAGQSLAGEEEASDSAENLARMNSGAKIEYITPDGHEAVVATATNQNRSAAALITENDTLSCPLQEGQTTFIITLPTTSLVDRFSFRNENAAARGELTIAVSNYKLPADSAKWMEVDGRTQFTNKRLLNVSLVGVEARYVRLSFNTEKSGRIAALGLYGGETLQGSAQHLTPAGNTASSAQLEERQDFDFANLNAKGRVVYVSSGSVEAAKRMIDNNDLTGFSFAANDPPPTVIFELAEQERLHRVSARYEMAHGHMDVYLLDKLPEGGNLSNSKPVAAAITRDASGKAAISFDPQGARYVALRWTPAKSGDRALIVMEVNAFGDMPLAMLQSNEAPDLYASNSSGLQGAPQSSPDISSSTLGTLAVPPLLPEVSP